MEDSLGQHEEIISKTQFASVLILVVMEDSLGQTPTTQSNGRYSRS